MNGALRMGSAPVPYAFAQQTGRANAPYAWVKGENTMKIARLARAAAAAGAVLAAGAIATAGAAGAAPALNLGADTASPASSAATPVHHYGTYHGGYYNNYYQPYYQPYGYAPYGYAPPPRYYAPYAYRPYGYYGYRHPHSGLYIRTPGLRLGIGF
jgi:hypothetical protein